MSNKYNRTQNIRKRKNYRKTKKNKYNRIEGGLSRQSSLKTLYSKHKIAFKICDDYITNNCVIEDREYLKSPNKLWKSIILNEKEYKKTGINGEYGSIDIIESSDLLTQPKSSDLLTQPEKLCVKSFSDPNNYEEEKNIAKIINKLIQNNKNDYEDKFGVVPSYYNDEFKLIVMHHKNSDLKYLLDTKRFILTKYTYIEICKDIFKYVKNLALEGLFYVDLKETNILIQNEYPPYKVYLGDIGGIAYIPGIIGITKQLKGTQSKYIASTYAAKDIYEKKVYSLVDIDEENTYIYVLCNLFHQILLLLLLLLHNDLFIKNDRGELYMDLVIFYHNNETDWKDMINFKTKIIDKIKNGEILNLKKNIDIEIISNIFEIFFFPSVKEITDEWNSRINKHINKKKALNSIFENIEIILKDKK